MQTDYLQQARERIEAQRKAKEGLDPLVEFIKLSNDLPPEKRYGLRGEIPEPYLEYCDWFVMRTGIEPDKRNKIDWMVEFPYWASKGLTIADLEAAYAKVEYITRPGSLTDTAIALKARKRASYHARPVFRASEQPDVKAVPPPADLYEQTRARIRAKAAQDRAGTLKHDPQPIGEVLKGMQP